MGTAVQILAQMPGIAKLPLHQISILNNVLDHCSLISKKGFGLIMLSTALTIPRINKMKQKGFKITKLLYFQVKKWFGFTCVFVVFSKTGDEIFNIEPKKY